jgi:ribosomal protein S18 acetylase RimI-like enzyme
VSDLEIRTARGDELDAVGALTAAAYAADGFGSGGYAEVLRDASTRARIAEVLVAVAADGLVGTATLVPPDAPPEWRETDRPGAATMRMLAVAPAARGTGVGTALTRACLARARERGFVELTLLTQPGMRAAHRIYAALGFLRDERLDRTVPGGIELLGYRLPLGDGTAAAAG